MKQHHCLDCCCGFIFPGEDNFQPASLYSTAYEHRARTREFALGALQTLPLVVAAFPFGIVFVAMAHSGGLDFAITLGMSVIVFVGVSQLLAITLLLAASAMPVIILTVFVVNLQQMLYSANLMHHVERWVSAPQLADLGWARQQVLTPSNCFCCKMYVCTAGLTHATFTARACFSCVRNDAGIIRATTGKTIKTSLRPCSREMG